MTLLTLGSTMISRRLLHSRISPRNQTYSTVYKKKLHMKKGSKLVKFMKKRVKTLLDHLFISCTGMYVFKKIVDVEIFSYTVCMISMKHMCLSTHLHDTYCTHVGV